MEDDKGLALFEEILEKTRSGRIKWEPTADEDRFVASVAGKFTILIKSRDDTSVGIGLRVEGPALVLKDADDRVLITVGYDIQGIGPHQLEDLWEMVRRRALRVDEKVDEALTELA